MVNGIFLYCYFFNKIGNFTFLTIKIDFQKGKIGTLRLTIFYIPPNSTFYLGQDKLFKKVLKINLKIGVFWLQWENATYVALKHVLYEKWKLPYIVDAVYRQKRLEEVHAAAYKYIATYIEYNVIQNLMIEQLSHLTLLYRGQLAETEFHSEKYQSHQLKVRMKC